MHDQPLRCQVTLRHEDFIMRNHRVHGVSVLPGVAFLELACRSLRSLGWDLTTTEIRHVVFAEPVVTTPARDREIRLLVSAPKRDGTRRVLGESRWEDTHDEDGAGGTGEADGRAESRRWRENFRATLASAPAPVRADRPEGPAGGTVRTRSMEDMYAHTRSRRISHGAPMRCRGTLHVSDSQLLAELTLDEPAARLEEGFHLHPAKLDAATIVAYGHGDSAVNEPFIPMFVERFRAPRPLPGPFTVLVPEPERLRASGELFESDLLLYDEHGRFAAEFTGLCCKRIREPGLIRRLLDGPPSAAPTAHSCAADNSPRS